MKALSSIDLHFLMREFRELDKAKVNQIYGDSNKNFAIEFYSSKAGRLFLIVKECKYVFLSRDKPSFPEPSSFILMMRKRMKNAVVKTIEQPGSQRIVHLELEKKEKIHIYIELFAKGNLILCDEKNKIIGIAQKQKWKGREISVNKPYEIPESEIDYTNITVDKMLKITKESNEIIVKVLATKLNLGGIYSEEICIRSNIDKNKNEITKEEAAKIVYELDKIIKSETHAEIIKENSNIIDIIPLHLNYYDKYNIESVDSLSGAYSRVLSEENQKFREKKVATKYDDKISKVEERIREQTEHIENLKKSYEENQAKGDSIFSNYQDISTLMSLFKSMRKEMEFEKLKKEFMKNKRIKNVTQKGEITIDIN